MKFCPICDKNYDDNADICTNDGASLRVSGPKLDSMLDKVIKGRYRVIKKLGEGGMGSVYLAEQFAINRKVALKILHPDYARDEDFVRRFRQEATLAASFSHHNVITVFDFDQSDDGSLYIVMEYVDGLSLSDVIRNGPMAVSQALDLAVQIAEGLSAAHSAGVIHRDIKPDNIMVVGSGGRAIKLMDFGIARLRDTAAATRLTQTGMIMGTPAYMAPEQIESGELTERTDIYAFGIVIYEMLAGRVPFSATSPGAVLIKHLHESPTPLSKVRKGVPSSVERIVAQALQKNPDNRLASMEEVADALKKAHRDIDRKQSTGVNNLIAPRVALIRQKLASVANPLKRLLGGAAAEQVAAKSAEASTREVASSVAESFNVTPPSKTAGVGALRNHDLEDEVRQEPTELPEQPDLPSSGDRNSLTLWSDKTPDAENSLSIEAASPMETIAETIAFTQPLQTPDHLIQSQEASEGFFQPATEVGREAPAASPVDNHTIFDDSAASADIAPPSITVEKPLPGTENIQIFTEPGRISVTGQFGAVESAANETMAETQIIPQAMEDLPSRKKGRLLTAFTSVLVLLIAFIGGSKFLGYLDYFSSPSPTVVPPKQETPTARSETFAKPIQQVESDNVDFSPASPTPEPPAKGTDIQPIEKSAPLPAPINKKVEPVPVNAEATKAPVIIARPDPDRKPFPGPEKIKKPDPPTTKNPEPPPDAFALNKSTESSPPPVRPPRVELKDLFIAANKQNLLVKERLVMSVKGRFSDGKESYIGSGVHWKSSNTSVASINAKGEIEGLKEGKTQISAIMDGVASNTYVVSVIASEASGKTEEPVESKTNFQEKNRRILR